MDGKMIAGMYDLEETLGSGHFAVVKLARHVITGDHVAVKVIDKTKLDKTARDHLFQEVRCMKLVQHPSIIRLYQVIDTQSKLYLILELGENGDLYEYINKHSGGVGEDESRDLFHQIVAAIAYCHRLHVVHRDLKPENVVFCQNAERVKLTDFGLSNLFAPGEKLKTSCGSLSYAAPEILLGETYDAPAVDLWSLGVILYMLLVGVKPFVGGTDSETLTMIMDCNFEMPSHLSPESVDLVKKLLVANPKERISLEEVMCHPWMIRDYNSPYSSQAELPRDLHAIDESDRMEIVQAMIDRGVAEKDAIDRSLESNAYDHIAATYYLMAEAHFRKKEDLENNPMNHVDLERLDRRRQRVRKLSTPGSPARPPSNDMLRAANQHDKVGDATGRYHPGMASRGMLGNADVGLDSPASPSRHIRRGAAETGVLRPVRRTTMVGPPGSVSPGFPTTPDMPIGRSLRRSSLTCKLQNAKGDDSSGTAGIGTLHFTLPLSAQTTGSAEDRSPPSAESTPPSSGSSLVAGRSLLQIDEAEQNEASESSKDSTDGLTLSDLTASVNRLAGEMSPDSDSANSISTPTRGGMYPNWLTGHQNVRTRTSFGSQSSRTTSSSGQTTRGIAGISAITRTNSSPTTGILPSAEIFSPRNGSLPSPGKAMSQPIATTRSPALAKSSKHFRLDGCSGTPESLSDESPLSHSMHERGSPVSVPPPYNTLPLCKDKSTMRQSSVPESAEDAAAATTATMRLLEAVSTSASYASTSAPPSAGCFSSRSFVASLPESQPNWNLAPRYSETSNDDSVTVAHHINSEE